MNLHAAYEIVRAGDAYMLKKYLDENAGNDKNLAKSIIVTLDKQINKSRLFGWLMIIVGFITALMIVGLLLIPAGIWHLISTNRLQKTVDEGYKLWVTEHP